MVKANPSRKQAGAVLMKQSLILLQAISHLSELWKQPLVLLQAISHLSPCMHPYVSGILRVNRQQASILNGGHQSKNSTPS